MQIYFLVMITRWQKSSEKFSTSGGFPTYLKYLGRLPINNQQVIISNFMVNVISYYIINIGIIQYAGI